MIQLQMMPSNKSLVLKAI